MPSTYGGSALDTLQVSLGERSYPILIEHDLLPRSGEEVARSTRARKALVVTHPHLHELYGETLADSLRFAGIDTRFALVPPGERRKSMIQLQRLLEAMLSHHLDRTSVVVALGGGVIGDLAGFAASVYMRGIALVQIPTTLLAAVDSSVGGKTAVNFAKAKNVVGAFHQPRLVLIDPLLLRSLPAREIRSGAAEVIKYAAIWDEAFFRALTRDLPALLALDPDVTAQCIHRSCQIKAEIVSKDERDLGVRAILNYGHTLGHAIEAVAGYGSYRHGEAVAIGMVGAARLSERLGTAQEPVAEPLAELVALGRLPRTFRRPLDPERLVSSLMLDKKQAQGKVNYVLARRIGQVECRPLEDLRLLREVVAELQPRRAGS